MGTRLEFQTLLEGLGDVAVYFQPPPNVTMTYPCIVYNRDFRIVDYADNLIWQKTLRYQVTVIDRDPDSTFPELVGDLTFATFVRHFTTEGLNHDIYDVYF